MRFVAFTALTTPALSRSRARIQNAMSSPFFAISLIAAVVVIGWPAYFAEPSDASRLGFYGEDYEGNLCGHLAFRPDGSRARDLRARPFAYWMNATASVCVRHCPRLADEIVCEYPFEAVPVEKQRAQLGSRCFAQLRTRPSFPACLPYKPAAAAPIDRWLATHAVDQLAADTLQASAVILGSWCAAGLASLVVLGGLVSAPRLTLVLSMASILLITFSGAAMLLPHGTHILAAARAPLQRQEALYWREEIPGFVQFSLGWAACAAVGLLVLTLWQRARHAPLAAALLATASRPLRDLPQLLIFPLYLFIAVGAPLTSWITAVVYLAAPCGSAEGCSSSAIFWRVSWPLTLAAPYWLAAAVTAWAYCAVGGAVGNWYADLAPTDSVSSGVEGGSAANGTARAAFDARRPATGAAAPAHASAYTPGASRRWPLWRSGWLSIDSHFGSIGAAAFLLPLVSIFRVVLPPAYGAPRRSVNPYSRACVGALQGCLRLLVSFTRSVHPGALVYLARHAPIGADDGVGGTTSQKFAAQAKDADAAADVSTLYPTRAAIGFLDAGERCADLFEHSQAQVASVREHAHYFYALLKWTISLGCALVGWLCLTNAEAPLLLSPLWPAAIILEGSFILASAALAVHEASLEAVLQSYCTEAQLKAANAAAAAVRSDGSGMSESAFDVNVHADPPSADAAAARRAAELFGDAALTAGFDYSLYGAGGDVYSLAPHPTHDGAVAQGTRSTLGPSSAGRLRAVPPANFDDSDALDEMPQVPPSYGTMPLAASALAGA